MNPSPPYDDDFDADETDPGPKTITRIHYDAKHPGRVDIFLDGQKAFSINALEAGRLECGTLMDPSEIKKWIQEDEAQRCWSSTLRLLAVRPQSHGELKRRLQGKKFSGEAIHKALARAKESDFINDERFARGWIDSRLRHRPKGRYLLAQELRQKGIEEAIIHRLLSEDIDETAGALSLIRKKAWRWKGLDKRLFKQKAYTFLAGKGFTFDISSEAVDQFLISQETER